MRILVAGAFEASSHWAHAINTVKTAEGFSSLGHDVVLLCRHPQKGPVPSQSLAADYGLHETLRWVQLPPRTFGYPLGNHWAFALQAAPTLLRERPDVVFARAYVLPWVSSRMGFSTVAESHANPENHSAPFRRLVAAARHREFRLWVTISNRLAEFYASRGVPRDKLAVLADGVDLSLFTRPENLPENPYRSHVGRPAVVYAGHLYDYKGIPTILEAARLLPEYMFHLVGGWPRDVERQKARAADMGLSNVTFHGLQPHAEVAAYLWHAQALLLPPSANHPSAGWTSPVKLGEYLISGAPVVATRIPALEDWVTDQEVCFVTPDDPQALAKGIQSLLSHADYAARLAAAAARVAQGMSYTERARRILKRLHPTGEGASLTIP
jgi:glycosyltransferase involved in cell wall biosynthesis